MGGCRFLTHLDLGGNDPDTEIHVGSWKDIENALKSCTSLVHVNLSHCSETQTQFENPVPLLELLQNCHELTHLNLSRVGLRAAAAGQLADRMRACTQLQDIILAGRRDREFDLPWNDIRHGLVPLASWFARCERLQVLDLAHNAVEEAGMAALATALESLPRLRWLDLQNNLLMCAGAQKLAVGLPHCLALEYLNVSGSRIGDPGASALAEGLRACTALTHLEIEARHCRFYGMERVDISDQGATALAESFPFCAGLQLLNLAGNQIGSEGSTVLGESLAQSHPVRAAPPGGPPSTP